MKVMEVDTIIKPHDLCSVGVITGEELAEIEKQEQEQQKKDTEKHDKVIFNLLKKKHGW